MWVFLFTFFRDFSNRWIIYIVGNQKELLTMYNELNLLKMQFELELKDYEENRVISIMCERMNGSILT